MTDHNAETASSTETDSNSTTTDSDEPPASNVRSLPGDNPYVPDTKTFSTLTDPAERDGAIRAPEVLANDHGTLSWHDYHETVEEATGALDDAEAVLANARDAALAAAQPNADPDALNDAREAVEAARDALSAVPDATSMAEADARAKAQERLLMAADIRARSDEEMDPETLRWLDRDELTALWQQVLVDDGVLGAEEIAGDAVGNDGSAGSGGRGRELNVNTIRDRARAGPSSTGTLAEYRANHAAGESTDSTGTGEQAYTANSVEPEPAPETLRAGQQTVEKGTGGYFAEVRRLKRKGHWTYLDPDGYDEYRERQRLKDELGGYHAEGE